MPFEGPLNWILNPHSSPDKTPRTTHDLGIDFDASLVHTF